MTDWLTDRALDFLAQPRQSPFFCMLSIPDPHEPYAVREPYASLYNPADMTIPRSFRETHPPVWAHEGLEGCCSALAGPEPEAELRRTKAIYCGEVKCIDDNVGRLLAGMEQAGVLDDTLIVFTSDHGDYMGEHGLYGKNRAFDTAYRIPMIMRWPRRIPAGLRISGLASTVDFMPTLLGIVGLPLPSPTQGSDLSPLAVSRSSAGLDAAFFHHSHFDLAGVFTTDFELALWRSGAGALFDRRNDPDQLVNRFNDPALANVVTDLVHQVVNHNRVTRSPSIAWLAAFEERKP